MDRIFFRIHPVDHVHPVQKIWKRKLGQFPPAIFIGLAVLLVCRVVGLAGGNRPYPI